MSNYVQEHLAYMARTRLNLIETLYEEDLKNPLMIPSAIRNAINDACLALNEIETILLIGEDQKMAKDVAEKRDSLLALAQEVSKSRDEGEGFTDDIICEIRGVFDEIIKKFEAEK